MNDRQQDNWEPLLSIATVAGGDWFDIGTAAALKLSGGENVSLSIGTELLADIYEVFELRKADRISTAELIHALSADEEKPWSTYNKGFPIKPRQIAAKLKGYSIQSKNVRNVLAVGKGYFREQFIEAFNRYIPNPSDYPLQSATELQPASIAASRVADTIGVADLSATSLISELLPDVSDIAIVADCNGYDISKVTREAASILNCSV